MAYLSPLSDDQRTTFLVVSLPKKSLRRLVGALGTAPKGTRIEKLSPWELAWTLIDFYESDAEVSGEVDGALLHAVGESPLAQAVTTDDAGGALTELVLRSQDPLRDLAWAILSSGPESSRDFATELVQAIIEEFDAAEARAKEEEESRADADPVPMPDAEQVAEQIEKETKSAKRSRARAIKRAGDMKTRVGELEATLADTTRTLKAKRQERADSEAEAVRAVRERDELRARLDEGTAGEVVRLQAELDRAERRIGTLEQKVGQARDENERLSSALREAGQRRPAETPGNAELGGKTDPSAWSLPVFTAEFYDSIKAWDRKILRIAFEKIVRLSEDWRHPSLRAIPLEGLAGHYRIRIASDVRLIYRLGDAGRIEILSLIDREDLTRYIRIAKR